MLATFVHTAGLTGTEVGVAAATAFLNQKLLGALFGEAAMVELVGRARQRLDAALAATFDEERRRFDALAPSPRSSRPWRPTCARRPTSCARLPAVVPLDAVRALRRGAGDDAGATGRPSAAGRRRGGRRRRVTAR